MSNKNNNKKSEEKLVYVSNEWVYNRALYSNRNKYFNLFLNNFEWTGLDYRQIKFIMTKLWDVGKVAAFKIPFADELGFAGVAAQGVKLDMYNQPEQITLEKINSNPLIPTNMLTVDKDVVIGYLKPDHQEGLKETVEWYIQRIAQAECVINTNLQLQKMPFLIPVDDTEEAKKVNEIVKNILNNKIVITATGVDPAIFKAVPTQSQYIIDKLVNYKIGLENELKTIIGIDNKGQEKIEQLQMSEINANNAEINSFDSMYENELQAFCERINETFGISISVKCKQDKVVADGQYHEMTEKPGPREGEENDELL